MAMCSVPRDDPAAPEGECDGKTDRGLDLSHLAPGAWGLRGAVASAGWAFGEAGGSQVTGDLCLKREERALQGSARLLREREKPQRPAKEATIDMVSGSGVITMLARELLPRRGKNCPWDSERDLHLCRQAMDPLFAMCLCACLGEVSTISRHC
jgi:hypothetical protein